MGLEKLFAPQGIAVVGASDNARKFGGLTLENLMKGGFTGNLVPVNAARDTVMGLKSYKRVSDAPGPIDVAVLTIPKRAVPEAIQDCARARVSYLVVMTGGYSETGTAGLADERALVAMAHEHGMRVIGPNLLGLASSPSRLLMNASLAMREVPARLGTISLVSQSGAAMGILYNRGAREGIAYRHLIALGNQSDIEIADVLEYYAADPGTNVVIASIEGMKNPSRFFAAARRIHAAGKPFIVSKAGRTAAGARVAATHTGSLATAHGIFAARCEEEGITLVDNELTMARLAHMYAKHGAAPKGAGIALLSPSGGALVHTTDVAIETGVRLSQFSAETVRKLETLYVPGFTANPLDFANMRDNSFIDVGDGGAGIVSEDDDVAAIVGVLGTAHNLDEMVSGMAKGVARRKPVMFVVLPGSNGDKARDVAAEMEMLAVDSIGDGIEALRLWLRGRPAMQSPVARPADISRLTPREIRADTMLDEYEAKRLLARYGVAVSRDFKAASADEAVANSEAIGFPVVLKGFGPSLVHKSDKGAVRLGLADAAAVRRAWEEMHKALGPALEGCLVSEMVQGEAELIIGALHDPEFGPMVLFGAGGILAELLEDTAMLAAPAHPDRIRKKLSGLKIARILEGVRGQPASDLEAAIDAIHRVSHFAADAGAALGELDINPLILRRAGHGAVAVDARIRTTAQPLPSPEQPEP
ncbi:MAG: acetate--CoA ligase family protein [Alphaproteobacteria bacterium]